MITVVANGRTVALPDGATLTALHLPAHRETPPGKATPHDPVLSAACAQLAEYFAGHRRDFDLPLGPPQRALHAPGRTVPLSSQ